MDSPTPQGDVMADSKGIAVAEMLAGVVLFWSGFKGNSLKTTLTDLLKGQAPQSSAEVPPTVGLTLASDTGTLSSSTAPAAPASVSGNVSVGKMLATAYGWGSGQEWDSLYDLWERESGWSNTAANPSGAYGIPQALPASKMGVLANPPTNSATAQIAWGLSYIKSTYGDPIAAWNHEESDGWY